MITDRFRGVGYNGQPSPRGCTGGNAVAGLVPGRLVRLDRCDTRRSRSAAAARRRGPGFLEIAEGFA
jgi:hypothetical protein